MPLSQMLAANPPKLDPEEQHFHIPSPLQGLRLFLRRLPPRQPAAGSRAVVLYVHGGTFPSDLSFAHRLDGRSWRDELSAAGYDCWGLDFHGFGRLSDPIPRWRHRPGRIIPLARAEIASRQLEQAVRFIRRECGVPRLSIIAHSWGTIVAGRLAGRCPDLLDRLVFFGAIAQRPRQAEAAQLPAWRLISRRDQWDRFVADVPAGETAVLSPRHFEDWGVRDLDVDPESGLDRRPP